jgi:carbamoyl-phosphate synthase large subunit
MLKNKNIFISGGNGVIGNELVRQLHDLGANLMVGDLKPRPSDWARDIRYRQGDLNYITSEELLAFEPEYFFHLAATFERSTETYDFWYENHQHNSQLGTHLLTILKDCPTLKKVINCSSYLIYDPQMYNFEKPALKARKLKETDPIYPRNLTGVAKLYHEIELRFLNDHRGDHFKSVSARIYRSYGKNSRDIISRWIRSLLKNEPLTVYRKEGLFDYIYAGDVASGLIQLAICDNCVGIFNLGTGRARRVSEILDILKIHFPNLITEESEIDIPYEASEADIEKLISFTGWRPETPIEASIPMMIHHERTVGFKDDTILPEANVLITSISNKIPLLEAVQKAAAKMGKHINVYGADINPACTGAFLLGEKFWQMPAINNLEVKNIIDFCNSHRIKTIIPTRDGELMFWANIKKALKEAGISLIISDSHAVEICLDKLLFYTNDLTKNYPVIPTSAAIDELADCRYFVVKERFGAGAKSIGINLEKEAAIAHARTLQNPVFQPFVDGTEISVDVYTSMSGKAKGAVCRTRDVIVDGESQITTIIQDDKLSLLCSQFAETIGLYGPAVLQVIKDSSGNYHIIECNSRFGGASTLSIAAGLDIFYWALLEAGDVDISEYSFYPAVQRLRQIRYKKDELIVW